MTTPDATADLLAGEIEPAPAPTAPERRNRRKLFLLLILTLAAAAFLSFAIWYLLFRKPISEFIPPVTADVMPTYQAAYYDLAKPLGIAVSADGSHIYVTQTEGTQETVMLDAKGTKLAVLAPPATVTQRATQLYLAADPLTGDIYATDRIEGQVLVYAADGSFRRLFDPGLTYAGWQPLAVGFDKSGNLYVADVSGAYQTIHEFDRDGKLVRDFGGPGVFDFPNGIAVDPAGNLYVTDSNNGRLLIFGANGQQLGLVPRGTAAGSLGLPRGVAIDDRGRVHVVDSVGQGVQVYRPLAAGAPAPEYINRFGTEGTVAGTFEFPNGIAIDGRGRVYVADFGNDRIQVWSY